MIVTLNGFSTFVHGINTGDRNIYEKTRDGTIPTGGLPSSYMTGDDKYMFASCGYFSSTRMFDNPYHNIQDDRTHTMNLKFIHTYSPRTYYELNFGATTYASNNKHMKATDPTIIKYIFDEKTGESVEYDEYPVGYTIRNYKGYGNQDMIRMSHRSYSKGVHDNLMTDFSISSSIVSQINKYNQLKAGFILARTHINEKDTYTMSERGNPIDQRPNEWAKWKCDPWQADFYIQDKLEWEGLILNAGLRGLWFDPNTLGYTFNEETFFSYDDESNAYWSYMTQWGSREGEGNWMWQNWRTRKLKTKVLLQPRLGASHPISETSKIFFNYGHFYSMPNPASLYSAQAVKYLGNVKLTGRTGVIPQPDLDWPKLVAYEIGYSQSIYEQILLQISGYYKDYTGDPSIYNILTYGGDVDAAGWFNNMYRDIRGLEFRLERSFGRFINGWANYNYMIKSWGFTGLETINEDPVKKQQGFFTQQQKKPEAQPTFRLNVSLRTPVGWGPGPAILGVKPLSEWRLNILYRWQDGGRRLWNSSAPPKEWFYVDYRNIQMWNMYVTKKITRGMQFYMQVQNVFNIKRLRDTGSSYRDSLHLWFEDGDQQGDDTLGDYKADYIYTGYGRWTTFLPDKRDIFFGLRYQF